MGTREQAAALVSGRKTGRARIAIMAAVMALSVGAPAMPWGAARAETISAQTFVLHNSWDVRRTADDTDAVPKRAKPAAGTNTPVLTVDGPGRLLAASADSAKRPSLPADAAGSPVLVPTVSVARHTLPFPGRLGLRPAALHDDLLFTPTTGGPAIALQLFFPAPLGQSGNSIVPFGDAAEDDVLALRDSIGGAIGANITGQKLASLHQGYLAQIAPGGLESLHEARCAAATPPRPAGCGEALGADAEAGSFLTRLGLESIPLPPAAMLLCTALACLGAMAWRRRLRAG